MDNVNAKPRAHLFFEVRLKISPPFFVSEYNVRAHLFAVVFFHFGITYWAKLFDAYHFGSEQEQSITSR